MACLPENEEPLTFRYHLGAPLVSLDPARATDLYSMAVIDRLFDGLLRFDLNTHQLVPELAGSYEVSEGGRVYDFFLVDSAHFHHGRPVVAADVKYSWERLFLQEVKPPFAQTLSLLEGADAVARGEAQQITGLEVLAEHHLRVRLMEPSPTFLLQIAQPSATVVPREEAERLGTRFEREPIGSGPFRFAASVGGSHVELKRWGQSARPLPEVEVLIFRIVADEHEALKLFKKGELDLVSRLPVNLTPEELDSVSDRLHKTPGLAWTGFCVRSDRPPFDDVRLRRALSLAIDRGPLVERLGATAYLAAASYLPPTIPIHDPSHLDAAYDLSRAQNLLEEAGFPSGQGLQEIVYATRPNAVDDLITNHIVDSLTSLGLNVRPVAMEFSALIDAIHEGRYDMFRWSWVGDYPDPEAYFHAGFQSNGPSNMMGFSDPAIDALLKQAEREVDPQQREQLFRQIDTDLLQQMPCVNLLYRTERVLLSKSWDGLMIGNPFLVEVEKARFSGSPE